MIRTLLLIVVFAAVAVGQETVAFQSGVDGNASYRIPAIVKLRSGKLLAFAEGRKDHAGDFGDVNIVLRTSVDQGRTWSTIQDIVDNGELQAGNPAPVVDLLDKRYPKGRIFLFYNTGDNTEGEVRKGKGKREVWYITSTDEGRTWSDAVNITSQVKRTDWRAYANTPGHAVQITSGKHKGRIFVPINYSKGEPQKDFLDYMAAGFFTDDHGKTFKISDDIGVKGSNESTAAELPNGGLLLNARNQRGDQKLRIAARSGDGGATWESVGIDKNLPDPICQGSLLNLGSKTLAFSNNADPERRDKLTLRISFDAGLTWAKSILIDAAATPTDSYTAYSDIVVIDKRRIGILYEKDDYKKIVFKIIKWR